jgi:tetratricopeptide (TPR) repeat protein
VGHQGVGKSRIIKEFYRHVASQQTAPAYWPAEIRPEGLRGSRDPLPERKVLGPIADVWPADALPDFLWWDFEGDLLSSGSACPALLAGEAKLKKHERVLWEVHLRRRGIWNQLSGTLQASFRDLAQDQSVEQLGKMLGEVGVVIPGLGFAVQRIVDVARYARQRQEARRDLRMDVSLDDGTADLGIELASRVLGLCESVPVVVTIEDAHWAEPSLCGFLRVLATSHAKVLVLATAWREGMAVDEPQHYFAVLEQDLRATGFAQRVVVEPPDAAERYKLLQDFATANGWQMPHEVLGELVQRYTTPLGIVLAMTSDFMQRFVADGCLREELDEMPKTLVELYGRRWEELDEDVRDTLILAALLSPSGATEGESTDGRVSLELIRRSLTALEDMLPSGFGSLFAEFGLESAYQEAVNDAAWLIEIARATEQFREPELAAIAMERAKDRGLTRRQRNRVRRVYLDVLRAVLEGPDSPVKSLAAAHFLTLDGILGDDEVPDDRHLGLAAITSAREYASAYQFREAVDVLASVKDRVDPATRMDALRDLASICVDASFYAEAAGHYRELLDLVGADLTHFVPDVAGLVAELTECEVELHRYAQVEQLLGPIVATLPEGLDELAIRLRRNHAKAIRGDRKRLGEAQALLEALLIDIEAARVDSTLWDVQEADTRMSLAITHQRAGRHAQALSHMDVAIGLRRRAFGEDARETLTALSQKALVLKETTGRSEEGVALQREVLQRRLITFGGPRHPQTLKSRHAVAFSLIATDPRTAARDLEGVLADKREVLGPNHLSTITSLSALARAFGATGELGTSIELYDEAVDLKERYGSRGDVLLTRRSRLRILRDVDCTAAREEARLLVAEYQNERGLNSVGTLRARFEEAETAAACEGREAGLRLHRSVLADRREHLASNHRDIADSEAAVKRLEG